MGKNIKRIFLLIILIFTVISCDLKNAEKAFENGDYVTAVRYSVKYLDGKKKFPDNKESKKIISNLDYIVTYYEDSIKNSNTIKNKIFNLKDLREIRILLDNKPYDKYINFFTSKYSVKELSEELADLYYTMGLNDEKAGNYREAENNFLEVKNVYKSFGSYKNADELYLVNRKKANEKEAVGYYDSAKSYEAKKKYCDARDYYNKAYQIYAEHGEYKDTKSLYTQNDKKCKSDLSESYYESAKKREATARYKYEYREIADLYYKSHDVYKEYGSINNAAERYRVYRNKGIVKVYLESDLNNIIRNNLKNSYVEYVSSARDSDITIAVDQDRRYNTFPERRDVRNLNEEGNNFREISLIRENELWARISINIRGKSAYVNSHEYVKSSYSKEINYDGSYPSKYKNRKENKYESENTLYNWMLDDAKKDILRDDISRINDIISGI